VPGSTPYNLPLMLFEPASRNTISLPSGENDASV